MSVAIRRLTVSDADAVLRLVALVGWNQTAADVRRLLALEPDGCFAACGGERVVGTVTTTTYGRTLAWVGMVLVDPEHRRRGIASALLETALEYLRQRGVDTVKLDATPEGRPVYERLGFVTEGSLERWAGQGSVGRKTSGGVWDDVAALDRAAFGADRGPLLRSVLADSPYPLCVARDQVQTVTGYAIARSGSRAAYVGPVVASDLTTARSLLAAVGDGTVFIDVNAAFHGATELLRELGFTKQRELLRMRLGPDAAAGRSPRVFAIAGPEVG